MSTTQSYHDVLSTLSGNVALAEARTALVTSISDDDLINIMTDGLKTSILRKRPNAFATELLEKIMTIQAEKEVSAQEQAEAGDGDDITHPMLNGIQLLDISGSSAEDEGESYSGLDIRTGANNYIEEGPAHPSEYQPIRY
jgi:hypothetical protein